jgi:hypothetical protein
MNLHYIIIAGMTCSLIVGCTTGPSTQASHATQAKENPNLWYRPDLVHDAQGRVPYYEKKAPWEGCFSKRRPLRRPAPFGELHEELFADVGGHLSVNRDQFVLRRLIPRHSHHALNPS